MKNSIYILIVLLPLFSLQAQSENVKKCNRYLVNNYKRTSIDKFSTIIERDTIIINTAKYYCSYSSLYLHKAMFDQYGKWDITYQLKNPKQRVLVWNNIKLFTDSNISYTVATSGLEDEKGMFTSVFVFDENNKDMFSETSNKRDYLLNYFGEMIKNNKSRKKEFYKVFWKEVDIEKWEKLYGKSK